MVQRPHLSTECIAIAPLPGGFLNMASAYFRFGKMAADGTAPTLGNLFTFTNK